MEIISFEKRHLRKFQPSWITSCRGWKPSAITMTKETGKWMDSHSVCRKLRISPRTLQTFRDNGTLAFTKIGNRTYYRPEDVERVISDVEDRRKEAKWKSRDI